MICVGVSPCSLRLCGIFLHLFRIKCRKVHILFSFQFYVPRQFNQRFQMLLLHGQQGNLLLQSLVSVKGRAVQNISDLFQRKLQLTKQQNLLQLLQRCIVIQPVSGLGICRRMQQPDVVIILQGAYAHTCPSAHFVHCHHVAFPPSW